MMPDDYSKLTEEARCALADAHGEARLLGHAEIGAGHVLLGLVARDGSVGRVLRDCGVSLRAARQALKRLVAPNPQSTDSLESAAELRVVLEAASRRDEVSTHVLCEALLSTDNTAARTMDLLGVDRMRVLARLTDYPGLQTVDAPDGRSLSGRLGDAVERAEILAAGVGRTADEGDVTVALLEDANSPLTRALAHLGVYRERLEEALADTRPRPPSRGAT